MKLRLFYTDKKGYVTTVDDVIKVQIETANYTKYLTIKHVNGVAIEKLADVTLAYLIDIDTMQELFRYEK